MVTNMQTWAGLPVIAFSLEIRENKNLGQVPGNRILVLGHAQRSCKSPSTTQSAIPDTPKTWFSIRSVLQPRSAKTPYATADDHART